MSIGKKYYLSKFQTFLILNITTKMKLEILAFLCCGEIIKTLYNTWLCLIKVKRRNPGLHRQECQPTFPFSQKTFCLKRINPPPEIWQLSSLGNLYSHICVILFHVGSVLSVLFIWNFSGSYFYVSLFQGCLSSCVWWINELCLCPERIIENDT